MKLGFVFFINLVFDCLDISRGSFMTYSVPQVTIAGLVGQEIELPCMVDAAKCGELHSIKWYRESTRIFVFSESANIAKSEGDFTDSLAETNMAKDKARENQKEKFGHVKTAMRHLLLTLFKVGLRY
ncbi:hypothetical protein RUM43_009556 [Polyplax serrata]|uniref:Ig-like domain-containing protein n=1 Tax=Polyplax serrata TaxID=468196 RepID=A0AAN8RUH8_POLSC